MLTGIVHASMFVASAGPKLACEAPICRFGTLASDRSPVKARFVIMNDGDEPMTIAIDPMSCGCSVAALSTNVLGPGGHATLDAELSMRGRRGAISKHFMVRSQPPHDQSLSLGFEGSVDLAFTAMPEQILFGTLTTNSMATSSSTVSFHIRHPDRILGCAIDSSSFKARWAEIRALRQYRVDVDVVPDRVSADGPLHATLSLHTERKGSNAIVLPIVARVCSKELIVSPDRLSLPAAAAQPATLHVMLTRRGTNALQVLEILPPSPGLTIRVLPMSGNACRIDVGGLTSAPETAGHALRIRTNVPDQEEVAIPIDPLPAPSPGPLAPSR